ncbi:MAG: hypothetical protein ACH6QS_00065 [Candidatus Makana argininalis]
MKKIPILINNCLYKFKDKKINFLNQFSKKYFIFLKIDFIFKKIIPIYVHKLFKILNFNKGIIIIEILNYSSKIHILKKQSILLDTIKYNTSINIYYIKFKINFNLY